METEMRETGKIEEKSYEYFKCIVYRCICKNIKRRQNIISTMPLLFLFERFETSKKIIFV